MPTLLVAIDGSEHALKALRAAIAHAAWWSEPTRLHLVAVHLPVPLQLAASVRKLLSEEEIARYYREEGEALLGPAAAAARESGLEFESFVEVGEVAPTLLEHARRHRCDMIYMGTRGLGAFAGLIAGSVAMKVLHLSDVPVVLVR